MSRTISSDLVDASHWTFVAACMSSRLRDAVRAHAPSPQIPRGVLKAAREFLGLAREAIEKGVPGDPVATAANYSIAARALRASSPEAVSERAALNTRLKKYAKLVDDFAGSNGSRSFKASDLAELAAFFAQVSDQGEEAIRDQYASDTLDA